MFTSRNTNKSVNGFSIHELMIVLIIFSILAMISYPSIQESLSRQRAEGYMQLLKQHLSYARIQAVSQSQTVSVCPLQAGLCQADWKNLPINIFIRKSDQSISLLRELSPPTVNDFLKYNRNELQFRADGSLNALQNGSFVYCVAPYPWHFRLSVSQAGRNQLTLIEQACPS